MTTVEGCLPAVVRVVADEVGPIVALPRLTRQCGLTELWAKAEWLNPTGSYKDRIARETVRDALRRRSRGWVGTSSGNAGAAMSAYGARAGLPGFLCVPVGAPAEKLRPITPYGVTVLPMAKLGLDEMDSIAALAAEFELKLAVTAYRYNPEGMAGAEAIGSELVEAGGFTQVYVPTGGGGLLVATARGLRTGRGDGPALVCAQPSACAPVARLLAGDIDEPRVAECTSSISGLQLPDPPDGDLAVEAVRSTSGWGSHVANSAAWEAQSLLAQCEGVFVEPAAALAIATVIQDARVGRIGRHDRPVAVLTGSGLKDLRRFRSDASSNAVAAGMSDLRSVLEARLRSLTATSVDRDSSPTVAQTDPTI